MAKYDAVDRLMSLATDKPTAPKDVSILHGGESPVTDTEVSPVREMAATDAELSDAEAVLEAKVSAGERPAPAVAAAGAARAAEAPQVQSTALAHPRPTAGERGRQLLGALRPFLPAVGGALRMVDHGAVQAVARLLPLLGSVGGVTMAAGAMGSGASSQESAAEKAQLVELLTAADKHHQEMTAELLKLRTQSETHDEQLRRLRDGLERTVAEQGSLSHLAHQLADRSKLLTSAVIILMMLVIAEMVMLWIFLHR